MSNENLLYRQISPSWIVDDNISSQAFRPTPKDKEKLSVYNGGKYSPIISYEHFTGMGLTSAGVVGVSEPEVQTLTLPIVPDDKTFDGHVLIDFTGLGRKDTERKAKELRNFAIKRKWLYRPETEIPPSEISEGGTLQGEIPQGKVSQVEASQSKILEGVTLQGEIPQGETSQVETLGSEISQGVAPNGEMPQIEASQSEILEGVTFQEEAPQGETSQVETVGGETSQGVAPKGDMSQVEASQGETPQSQTSQNDKNFDASLELSKEISEDIKNATPKQD